MHAILSFCRRAAQSKQLYCTCAAMNVLGGIKTWPYDKRSPCRTVSSTMAWEAGTVNRAFVVGRLRSRWRDRVPEGTVFAEAKTFAKRKMACSFCL